MPRLWTLLVLPMFLSGQTESTFPCQAPAEIRSAIREAGNVELEKDGRRRPFEEVRAERQQRFKALAAKHPDDFWIRRAYLDAMKSPAAPDDVIADYRRSHEADPGDVRLAYLYAHALTGTETPKAIAILTDLTSKAPRFPLPWLALANIYGYPNFNDRAKQVLHAEAYLDRCPATNEAAYLAMRLDKSEKLAAFTKALRERIAGKADEETIPQYRALWSLEFKIEPVPEHARLRSQVEEDLKFLEGLDRERHKSVSFLLQEGYKLTGNKEAQEKLTAAAKTPDDAMRAFFQAQEAWSKTNPYPTPADPPEKRQAFFRQRVQMLDEWIRKLPEQEFVRLDRLRSLSEITDTPDDVVRQEGEAVLAASRKQAGTVMMSSSAPMQVAEIWAKRGLELERAPALVREGQEAYARQRERQREMERSDLWGGAERQLMDEINRWHNDVTAWRTLVLAYSRTGKIAEAREVIAQWEAALEQRRKRVEEIRSKRPSGKAEPSAQAAAAAGGPPDRARMMEDQLLRSMPYSESQYFEALAQVALAEQRKLDALAFYQSALRTAAGGPMPSDPAKSETRRKAAALWKELGGTNEGWQSWLESLKPAAGTSPAAGPSRWTALSRPIPEFSLLDQAGQTWTVAKLRGKTTLLNVWATWCGPCRVELPHLQKLHDKLKDRDDVQVITLNVDDNTGLIEPFLKENNYSFPVLLAKSFIDSFTGPIGIPTNWISDRAGSLRLELLGFGGDGEEWIKQTLEQMEKIRESEAAAVKQAGP